MLTAMVRRSIGMEKKVGSTVCKLFIRPKETQKRKSLIGPIFLNGRAFPSEGRAPAGTSWFSRARYDCFF